jgi:uncharacterized membrane protein YraQ (UPF0718 family)
MFSAFNQEFAAAWDYFVHLATVLVPLFVVGSFFVSLLREYLPPERVERILRQYDGGSGNIVAAGTGAITPFCSASTVPILAGLLGAGAPLGIAYSFLLASPLVNELAIILLFGEFGLRTTVLYVLLTTMAAIIGGIVIGKLGLERHVKDSQLLEPDDSTLAPNGGSKPDCNNATDALPSDAYGTAESGCGSPSPQPDAGCRVNSGRPDSHTVRFFRSAVRSVGFFVDMVPYLLLGITFGAVIHAFVPAAMVRVVIGPENPFAVFIASIAGAPIYLSMSAMLPIAVTFTDQGIPIGTVLAFVVGSAGVSLPNLVLLNKLFSRTLLAIYAGTVVTIGIVIGVLFNTVLM